MSPAMSAAFKAVPLHFGLSGHARFQVRKKANDRLVRDTGWGPNLITNQGLDAIALQPDVMTHAIVGTSSTEPANDDTWVNAYVATTSTIRETTNGVSGADPHYGYKRRTWRFDVGAATGNMSEFAVAWSATTGTAFSHGLIRDSAGDPTTITVLSDEYLDFSYELRHIPPTVDASGSINIGATAYNYTVRALSVTSTFYWSEYNGNQFFQHNGFESYHRAYAGGLAAITASQPLGDDGGNNSGTTDVSVVGSYVNGSYQRDLRVVGGPTKWNVSGGVIKSLVLSCRGCRWQAEIGKVSDGTGFSKTTDNTLTMNWRASWARAA